MNLEERGHLIQNRLILSELRPAKFPGVVELFNREDAGMIVAAAAAKSAGWGD